jgi:hypothetical protein
MTDHARGRGRRDDSLVPLLTVLVVIAAFGPAAFTAVTQWLVPRLTAGRDAVSLSLDEWLSRNWWLVAFWVLELVVLFAFLGWSRRRRQRRTRQLDSIITGLSRVLPADWDPNRQLRVLRWNGHRPVRVRLELTPRCALGDPGWRRSLAGAARTVLGPLEPINWPSPPRNGVFDWGGHPPRVELRVDVEPSRHDNAPMSEAESNVSTNSEREPQFYRRPRPSAVERVPAESGSAPTRIDRED